MIITKNKANRLDPIATAFIDGFTQAIHVSRSQFAETIANWRDAGYLGEDEALSELYYHLAFLAEEDLDKDQDPRITALDKAMEAMVEGKGSEAALDETERPRYDELERQANDIYNERLTTRMHYHAQEHALFEEIMAMRKQCPDLFAMIRNLGRERFCARTNPTSLISAVGFRTREAQTTKHEEEPV